uniref:PHD-type domain-containing protein n=1 Tax=Gongylonema pulchrum TaxID=637853 RepID=A0A183EIB7_9BILA
LMEEKEETSDGGCQFDPCSVNDVYQCSCLSLRQILYTMFVRENEAPLEPNVCCMCTAEDRRYGVNYRCQRRAVTFCLSAVPEQWFCSIHSEMLHQHRLCLICQAFCTEGELRVCNEYGVQHWMHDDCYHLSGNMCCHCNTLYSAVTGRICYPYKDELFEKLEAICGKMRCGLQRNVCEYSFIRCSTFRFLKVCRLEIVLFLTNALLCA